MSSQFEELFKARSEGKTPPQNKVDKARKKSPSPPPPAKSPDSAVVAKSKNTDFEQALIYLKKTTKIDVKKSLLDDPSGRNFSDLVEELLSGWLKNRK